MAGVTSVSSAGGSHTTEMESWLLDVKRVRIPRPKVTTLRCPAEPPKDYSLSEDPGMDKAKRALSLDKQTEDLRRAIQEKL